MPVTTPTIEAETAAKASEALTTAGLSANVAWQIVDLLPPRGHHELTHLVASIGLDDIVVMWVQTLADRLRCTTVDAATVQRLIREAGR